MSDSYAVDAGNVDKKVLKELGYQIVHRPWFSWSEGRTKTKWMFYPLKKTCFDAAPADEEAVSFQEYLRITGLIENETGNEIINQGGH